MNRTDAPKKQPVPFGTNGPRQDLLETTPAGSNRASYDAGYPQVTMILKSAGGKPPEGEDMNQILFELSAIGRWQSAGAINSFDSSFSTAIGGYPKASVLVGSDGTTIYISTVDANTNDPNSSTTGWLNLSKITAIASLTAAADTLAYFTGVNSAAITALTSVGRDVIGLASLVQYLGLQNVSRSRITSYTTAGTYSFTVPDAVYRIHCRVVGGGGAGGSASAKSGGGGGGYAEGVITVTPGQVISITVGALGNGGTSGNVGTSGGASSVGGFMSASGGAYGDAGGGGTGAGGFGGAGTGGDINSVGSDGSDGTTTGAVGAGAGGGSALGGYTRSGGSGRNSLSIGGGGC